MNRKVEVSEQTLYCLTRRAAFAHKQCKDQTKSNSVESCYVCRYRYTCQEEGFVYDKAFDEAAEACGYDAKYSDLLVASGYVLPYGYESCRKVEETSKVLNCTVSEFMKLKERYNPDD